MAQGRIEVQAQLVGQSSLGPSTVLTIPSAMMAERQGRAEPCGRPPVGASFCTNLLQSHHVHEDTVEAYLQVEGACRPCTGAWQVLRSCFERAVHSFLTSLFPQFHRPKDNNY